MALTLPANFENDIQGKDTALVPLVVIGNLGGYTAPNGAAWANDSIHISTSIFSDEGGYTDTDRYSFTTLPILLNLPSLKESIDIEKRNYKISSVTLDISNYEEYNGKRFSELIGDNSLINTECRIF